MNIEEFTSRTNLYPDDVLFKVIHNEYANHNEWDKDQFCRAYLENRDGIAEKIQDKANEARSEQKGEVQVLLEQIRELNEQLEESKEWKPVESNYMDYIKDTTLNNEEAREIISMYIKDVHPESISIIRNKKVWEKNRFGELRRTDETIDMVPWAYYEHEGWKTPYQASIAFRFGNEEYVLNIEDGMVSLNLIFQFSDSFNRVRKF